MSNMKQKNPWRILIPIGIILIICTTVLAVIWSRGQEPVEVIACPAEPAPSLPPQEPLSTEGLSLYTYETMDEDVITRPFYLSDDFALATFDDDTLLFTYKDAEELSRFIAYSKAVDSDLAGKLPQESVASDGSVTYTFAPTPSQEEKVALLDQFTVAADSYYSARRAGTVDEIIAAAQPDPLYTVMEGEKEPESLIEPSLFRSYLEEVLEEERLAAETVAIRDLETSFGPVTITVRNDSATIVYPETADEDFLALLESQGFIITANGNAESYYEPIGRRDEIEAYADSLSDLIMLFDEEKRAEAEAEAAALAAAAAENARAEVEKTEFKPVKHTLSITGGYAFNFVDFYKDRAEVADDNRFNWNGFAVGLSYSYNFNKYLSIGVDVWYTQYFTTRSAIGDGFYFHMPILFNVTGHLPITDRLTFFASLGLGADITYYNSRWGIAPMAALSLGLTYRLSDNFSLFYRATAGVAWQQEVFNSTGDFRNSFTFFAIPATIGISYHF